MTEQQSLKEQILGGDEINQVRIPMDSSPAQVHDVINSQPCDMLYIDSQHGPHTEVRPIFVEPAGSAKFSQQSVSKNALRTRF
ncbi:hypothetical protein KFU94_56085 [Chloroflexi bacterium TSY]|nr:hypothetical protein [Chloroflexi bacterium TSY]